MSSNPSKPSVCRRLFDEPHAANVPLTSTEAAEEENKQNDHLEQLEQDYLNTQARWNFDFRTETPLEGDWEWEKVEPEPDVQPMEPGERHQRLQEELGRVQSAEEENHSL